MQSRGIPNGKGVIMLDLLPLRERCGNPEELNREVGFFQQYPGIPSIGGGRHKTSSGKGGKRILD